MSNYEVRVCKWCRRVTESGSRICENCAEKWVHEQERRWRSAVRRPNGTYELPPSRMPRMPSLQDK